MLPFYWHGFIKIPVQSKECPPKKPLLPSAPHPQMALPNLLHTLASWVVCACMCTCVWVRAHVVLGEKWVWWAQCVQSRPLGLPLTSEAGVNSRLLLWHFIHPTSRWSFLFLYGICVCMFLFLKRCSVGSNSWLILFNNECSSSSIHWGPISARQCAIC